MAKEINFVRTEEVWEDGISKLRYKGYDGNYHTINSNDSKGNVITQTLLSDLAKVVPVSDDVVNYFKISSITQDTQMMEDYEEPTPQNVTSAASRVTIYTNDDAMFSVGDTILVSGVYGFESDGITLSDMSLMLYVYSLEDEEVHVQALNGKKIGNVEGCVPSIEEGTQLIRLSRAMGELDVQTTPINTIPQSEENYCQIFKCQVEDSNLVENAETNAEWSLKNMEEQALADMIKCREMQYIVGVKSNIWDNVKKEYIKTTGGINKNTQKFIYNSDGVTKENLPYLLVKIFSNGKSKTRYLFAGSELITYLMNIGMEDGVNVISSIFGDVVVIPSANIIDYIFSPSNGIAVDPATLVRYVNIPLERKVIDKALQGETNTKAVIYTESSCLVTTEDKSVVYIKKV